MPEGEKPNGGKVLEFHPKKEAKEPQKELSLEEQKQLARQAVKLSLIVIALDEDLAYLKNALAKTPSQTVGNEPKEALWLRVLKYLNQPQNRQQRRAIKKKTKPLELSEEDIETINEAIEIVESELKQKTAEIMAIETKITAQEIRNELVKQTKELAGAKKKLGYFSTEKKDESPTESAIREETVVANAGEAEAKKTLLAGVAKGLMGKVADLVLLGVKEDKEETAVERCAPPYEKWKKYQNGQVVDRLLSPTVGWNWTPHPNGILQFNTKNDDRETFLNGKPTKIDIGNVFFHLCDPRGLVTEKKKRGKKVQIKAGNEVIYTGQQVENIEIRGDEYYTLNGSGVFGKEPGVWVNWFRSQTKLEASQKRFFIINEGLVIRELDGKQLLLFTKERLQKKTMGWEIVYLGKIDKVEQHPDGCIIQNGDELTLLFGPKLSQQKLLYKGPIKSWNVYPGGVLVCAEGNEIKFFNGEPLIH